jgi:hypothetical protein
MNVVSVISKCKYFEMAKVLTIQIMEAFSLWYI